MSLKYLGQYDFRKTNSGGIRNMVIYNEKKTKMRKYSSNRMWRKYKKKTLRERQESESLQEHLFFLSLKAKHIQVLFT